MKEIEFKIAEGLNITKTPLSEIKTLDFSSCVNPKDLPYNALIYLTRNQLVKNNRDIEVKTMCEVFKKVRNHFAKIKKENNGKEFEDECYCNGMTFEWIERELRVVEGEKK